MDRAWGAARTAAEAELVRRAGDWGRQGAEYVFDAAGNLLGDTVDFVTTKYKPPWAVKYPEYPGSQRSSVRSSGPSTQAMYRRGLQVSKRRRTVRRSFKGRRPVRRRFSRRRRFTRRVARRPRRAARRYGRYRRRVVTRGRSSMRRKYVRGGTRRRRSGRARFSGRVKAGIRQVVGDCFNQMIVRQPSIQYNQVVPYYNTLGFYAPHLFRCLSSWTFTKADYYYLMNRFLTPAQIANNDHMWIQGGYQRIRIHNPSNYSVQVKLDRFHSRAPIARAEYTNPGAGVILNLNSADEPGEFQNRALWSQQYREGITDGKQDMILSQNGAGVTVANWSIPLSESIDRSSAPVQRHNVWEQLKNNPIGSSSAGSYDGTVTRTGQTMARAFSMKLSWIFPRLKQYVKQRHMGTFTLGAFQSKTFLVRFPKKDITPYSLNDANYPMISKESFFYFIRAIAPTNAYAAPTAAGNTVGPGGSSTGDVAFNSCAYRPAVLCVDLHTKVGVRSSADRFPTYLVFEGTDTHVTTPEIPFCPLYYSLSGIKLSGNDHSHDYGMDATSNRICSGAIAAGTMSRQGVGIATAPWAASQFINFTTTNIPA